MSVAGTHERLPLPDSVVRGKIHWRYALTLGVVHLVALLAVLPWLFSWTGLILAVVGVFFFGQSINLCYHRVLTHKSLILPKWLEHAYVVLALCCLQDTPAKWVAVHRYHHKHSDHQEDPHSPLVAFLWAHVGWLLVYNKHSHDLATLRKYAPDVLKDPFYMKMEKSHKWLWFVLAHAVGFMAVGFAIGAIGGGALAGAEAGAWVGEAWRMSLSLLVWGVFVRIVAVWHITWSVNSLTHAFGYRNHETTDDSRNNWLVALLAVGEGWHNNHHADPASACNRHQWWELDLTWLNIKLLEKMGLAKKITMPRHVRHAERGSGQGEDGAAEPGAGDEASGKASPGEAGVVEVRVSERASVAE